MILERVSSGLSGPPRLSAMLLAIVNMVPILGVALWNWSTYEIVVLYWSENIVIGLLNLPRILFSKGGDETSPPGARLFLSLFFLVHYGIFCSVHGFFVFSLLGEKDFWEMPPIALPLMLIEVFHTAKGPFLLLFVSHLFSFLWNFIGHREYRSTGAKEWMIRPYGRIIVLHIAILFGAFAIELLGAPVFLLILLVTGKTALDLGIHLLTHGEFDAKS